MTRPLVPLRIVLPALMLAGLAACAPGRGIEALRLLADIARGPQAYEAPHEGVHRSTLPGGADLYLPATGGGAARQAAAALVLVPGLAPAGKADARLVGFATSLARADIAVLVPDIASLRALRAGPENVVEIADALRFLDGLGRAQWDRMAGTETASPVGVAAASYAVGPALLATLEPGLAGSIDFLVGIGGYHDLTAALTFVTTGWYRDATGAWRHGTANRYGEWAFVLANAGRIEDAADRTSLEAMARRRLADPEAPIDDLVRALGPQGRAVHALVSNTDPDRVPALIAALPAPIRADMAALDLAGRDLAGAPAHVLLLHGRDDTIIPAGESVALAAALGPGRAELVLLDSLAHVDLGLETLGDAWRLWRAAYWLLAVRDGAA